MHFTGKTDKMEEIVVYSKSLNTFPLLAFNGIDPMIHLIHLNNEETNCVLINTTSGVLEHS